jgi:hypothetical protein
LSSFSIDKNPCEAATPPATIHGIFVAPLWLIWSHAYHEKKQTIPMAYLLHTDPVETLMLNRSATRFTTLRLDK